MPPSPAYLSCWCFHYESSPKMSSEKCYCCGLIPGFGTELIGILGFPAGAFNFSTGDDFILDCLGKMHKICAIAGHSYQKISMQFGVPLCTDQCLPVDHIELNVLAATSEIGFYQMR